MAATVVYRPRPGATVTAGVLASSVDKREIVETFRVYGSAAVERRVAPTKAARSW